MAQSQDQDSDQPQPERYYIEYVEIYTDEAAANEPLREAINEKLRRGWRMVSMSRDPSGDYVELVWDTYGSSE